MVFRFIAVIGLLTLSACSGFQSASTDGRRVVSLSGPINDSMLRQVERRKEPTIFRLPKNGGYVKSAIEIADAANAAGHCFEPGHERILQSAGVLVARRAECFLLPDPDSKIFGVHLTRSGGEPNPLMDVLYYGQIGLRSSACLYWYQQLQNSQKNEIVFISWRDMDEGCSSLKLVDLNASTTLNAASEE